MTSNFDYLLIGNSRLHWAIKVGKKYRFHHSHIDNPLPEGVNINNLYWASVGKYETKLFKKENEVKIQDINLKNLPKYFGIDRALGCYAALKTIKNPYKKDIVIADLGTTLSITKIDSQGKLIGGQLIPGFLTQLRSMALNTKNLKMPKNVNIPDDNFLIDTQEAMVRGVQNALIGAIKLAFKPSKDILMICGGDSESLKHNFLEESQVFVNPNLVMEGMIISFLK